MARTEENADGKAVPVDTPEYGCVTVTPAKAPAKSSASKPTPSTTTEGDA